ncbi:Uncharacterised protein [Sphingobacterium multivorum]|uniref:hypothetical protein n=1 Tax=Sphingobacterium multivorum TaxID=28454 RepID=UPI000E034A3D|nr:hypothetical protein [Sphingobacterium multivorum]QQT47803.1 hypothetical protein I6J00_16575 [Sphingobacterium multivorum]SUI98458.1 Uncharacterised protein [Sphingobacterium multivorum]
MSRMLESLNNFLASKTKAEIMEIWSSGNYLDYGGLKVSDFLERNGYQVKVKSETINFETLKINDNLGSNSYSDLFYINHNGTSFFQNFELQVH